MKVMNEIRFYKEYEAYGYFSNFASYPILLKGKLWPTSEHYFQAQKFAGTELEETVRNSPSPKTAALIGKDKQHPLRRDWETVKDAIMREVVLAKFSQHEFLKEKLLETGDADLIESTKNDDYWADGGDGSGENMLRKILIEVREELRNRAGPTEEKSYQRE